MAGLPTKDGYLPGRRCCQSGHGVVNPTHTLAFAQHDGDADDMFQTQSLPPPLARLAQEQAGALSAAQVAQHLTRGPARRLAREWVSLGFGLHSIHAPTWLTLAFAGLLRASPEAVISGKASAYLHGALRQPPKQITIWASARTRDFRYDTWKVRFVQGRRSRFSAAQPARSGIEDALLDAARGAAENDVLSMVTRALAQRLTTRERLELALGQRGRVAHRQLFEDLVSPALPDLESVLEWLYLRRVEEAHDLPTPQRQVWLSPTIRADAWYETYGVVVETDGRDHDDFSRDLRRDNQVATATTAVVLRFGWQDVTTRPCEVAGQVARVLQLRGWRGRLRRCKRCAPTGQ